MSALNGKARTAETYLAGLGATGAVVAGVVSAVLLVFAMVVFDAWPRAATLSGPRAGVDAVESVASAEAAADARAAARAASSSERGSLPVTSTGGTGGAPHP
ncbi:MAG: hypothetical protein ACRDKH_00775, partial [Solirubrobacterales bacterium]